MTAAIVPMKWAADSTYHGSLDHCACCGKLIKGQKRWVEVIDGGRSVAALGLNPDEKDSGYMGFFPVGLKCAKKYFPTFTHPNF